MRFRPTEKTYLLLSFSSLSLAIFVLCYPYAESMGMNYLNLDAHPVVAIALSLMSIVGLLGFLGLLVWFVISIVQDWLSHKHGSLPKLSGHVDFTKMTPEQITAYFDGVKNLTLAEKTTKS